MLFGKINHAKHKLEYSPNSMLVLDKKLKKSNHL